MATLTVEEKPDPFNDNRLQELQDMARELKGLNRELRDMIIFKMDALLGPISSKPEVCEQGEPCVEGWVESTRSELVEGVRACRDSLERLSVV